MRDRTTSTEKPSPKPEAPGKPVQRPEMPSKPGDPGWEIIGPTVNPAAPEIHRPEIQRPEEPKPEVQVPRPDVIDPGKPTSPEVPLPPGQKPSVVT
jgi:hypothetical protein